MSSYNKPDFWSIKAQKEGYPARSVYKLQEIDEKFGLFNRVSGPFKVLDLGAAPGSWSLYALRRLGNRGFLTAADLAPLSRCYDKGLFDRGNYFFVQGDLTDPGVKEILVSQGPFHLVMSDAAPGTTGNSSVDGLRSLVLAETALDYADAALIQGGNLVVKVFQGAEAPALLQRIREGFSQGKGFKPQACRKESVEIYYMGIEKR